MEAIRNAIQTEFRQFDAELTSALHSENPLLNEALDYLRAQKGKQLRPILVMLSAGICRGITNKTIKTAVSMELMHTASLVHDDVVDNSPTRRGQNALHKQWNNKVAILVGDYMLAKAIEQLATVHNNTVLNIVAEMTLALTSGEILQLHANQSMWINEEQYLRIIEHKTARLFAACSEAVQQVRVRQHANKKHYDNLVSIWACAFRSKTIFLISLILKILASQR